MLFLALAGCDLVQPYLEEVREDPTVVSYQGWISQGPIGAEYTMLSDGTVFFYDEWGQIIYDEEGEEMGEAEQPHDERPGYWEVALPPDFPFQLRIEAPDSYPAVWKGRSPSQSGIWLSGALFSWPHATVDPFFEAISESLDIEIGDLKSEEVVHLWGQVLNREDADGSDWPIRDGDGRRVDTYTFRRLDDGSLVLEDEAPIDYVFAFDLTPGTIEVAGVVYETQAGDLVAPWWFEVLP